MKEKQMDISVEKPDKENISDLKMYGDGDTFRLLCKASSKEEGWMKSTKVCNVWNGCIVQVTTQQRNPDGSYSCAEALTFVPNNHIDITKEPRVIKGIIADETELLKKGETISIAMPENVSREEMDKIIEEVEEERKARIVKAINSYK